MSDGDRRRACISCLNSVAQDSEPVSPEFLINNAQDPFYKEPSSTTARALVPAQRVTCDYGPKRRCWGGLRARAEMADMCSWSTLAGENTGSFEGAWRLNGTAPANRPLCYLSSVGSEVTVYFARQRYRTKVYFISRLRQQ